MNSNIELKSVRMWATAAIFTLVTTYLTLALAITGFRLISGMM